MRNSSDKKHNDARRKFLLTSAGLGIAGTMGIIRPAHAMGWSFEELTPQPENTNWRLLSAHDTGYLTPDSGWKRKNCGHLDRLTFNSAPDGKPSYGHVVKKGGIVHPIGTDSDKIIADFSSFSRVLLRYHHWVGQHSNLPGKWIGLQLGRGWVAKSHPKPANVLYGEDGCSATTMHPTRDNGNGLRILSSYKGQTNEFGHLMGSGSDVLPTGRWMTVDIVVDKNMGYRLYLDGIQTIESDKVTPVANWEACRAIWYRHRLMHGGHPEDLPAIRDYKEWFGGFYIGVA